jgi:hypothetical protein
VPDTPSTSRINLPEVNAHAETAARIVGGFALTLPALADVWQQIQDSLSDIHVLTAEITRLRTQLTSIRLDRANLAAAARVTITAYLNGEADPLSYLCDELRAQGFGAERGDA